MGAFAIFITEESLLVGAIVGFILGYAVAWWLHKFFVYVNAAVVGFLVIGVLSLTLGMGDAWIFFGLLGSIALVYLVHKFHDIVLIIVMAIPWTMLLFYLSFPDTLSIINDLADMSLGDSLISALGLGRTRNQVTIFDANIIVLKSLFIKYFSVLLIFTWLSVFYQKFARDKKNDSMKESQFKSSFRILSFWFAIVSIVYFFFSLISGFFRVSFYFSIVFWPLLAYAISKLFVYHYEKHRNSDQGSKKRLWLFFVFISIILIPILIWILSFPHYVKQISLGSNSTINNIPFADSMRMWFYSIVFYFEGLFFYNKWIVDFFKVPNWIIIPLKLIQLAYYFVLIPLILNTAYHRNVKTALN